MFHATFVSHVESLSIPCVLSDATKTSANGYYTLRDIKSRKTCCLRQNRIAYIYPLKRARRARARPVRRVKYFFRLRSRDHERAIRDRSGVKVKWPPPPEIGAPRPHSTGKMGLPL